MKVHVLKVYDTETHVTLVLGVFTTLEKVRENLEKRPFTFDENGLREVAADGNNHLFGVTKSGGYVIETVARELDPDDLSNNQD